MILAAGLSPAWQQIVVLDALAVGEVNRAREVLWCASGKVLNVGLAAHGLCSIPFRPKPAGEPCSVVDDWDVNREVSIPAARRWRLIGGPPGDAIRREFAGLGVDCRWIASQAATRVCTTILDRRQRMTTELVENAGTISPDELEEFRSAYVEEASQAEMVVLTGSLPAGVPPVFYRDLLEKTPCRVVLDAQGELLLAALNRRPFVVKPNREELAKTLGRPLDTDAELHAAMRELCRRGATWVVVSQGKERVWVASERELYSLQPPQMEVINPIGSGDCLAAGIAVALVRGEDLPDAVELGMAAATENVRHLLPARVDPERVATMREAVCLSR